jgi:hypothetical protein
MAFPPDKIEVWIRHNVIAGRCTFCGTEIPTQHEGPIWVRSSGIRSTVEPMGNWKDCTA